MLPWAHGREVEEVVMSVVRPESIPPYLDPPLHAI
jgi:hypothetical protein